MMHFFRSLFLSFVLCVFAWADSADSIQAKIAYLNVTYPDPTTSVFVGQNYSVSYELTLFSGAKIADVSLVDFRPDNNVELLSKNPQWKQKSQDVLTNTYTYKIKAKDFVIPPLKIVAVLSDETQTEEVLASGLKLQAIDLSNNPNYANVIADSLNIVDYRVKEYDQTHNIVVAQLEGVGVNLESIKVGQYAVQGLESSKVVDGIVYGIYYVMLEKSVKNLSFDYFNLSEKRFVTLSVPIQLTHKGAEEAGNIKPRNTFLVFTNLIIGGSIFAFVLLWIFVRKIRHFTLAVIVLLTLFLLYNVFFSVTSGVVQAGAKMSIIPTHNSTTSEVIQAPTRVNIVGEYGDYYKVMVDSRVGWIRREYVRKS